MAYIISEDCIACGSCIEEVQNEMENENKATLAESEVVEGTSTTLIETRPSERHLIWKATNELRFKKSNEYNDQGAMIEIKVLQQLWISEYGKQEWRNVPEVE